MGYVVDIENFQQIDNFEDDSYPRFRSEAFWLEFESRMDKIVASQTEVKRLDKRGQLLWKQPFKVEGRVSEVFQSGDRLMVTTFSKDYHRWGCMGPTFLLNCKTGEVITSVKGDVVAPVSGGRFLVGLEGYDYFDIWLCSRSGWLVQNWRSCGHIFVTRNDHIRVVEEDRRSKTKGCVVRLLLDGTIEKGPEMRSGQTAKPLLLDDNSLLLVDAGVLRIIDEQLEETYTRALFPWDEEKSYRTQTSIKRYDEKVVVEIQQNSEANQRPTTMYRWHLSLRMD